MNPISNKHWKNAVLRDMDAETDPKIKSSLAGEYEDAREAGLELAGDNAKLSEGIGRLQEIVEKLRRKRNQ